MEIHLRTTRYRLPVAIYDHTILPTTKHKRTHPALIPASEGWYSIYLPWKDQRLCDWLHTETVYLPTDGQSPIQVLTRPGVE